MLLCALVGALALLALGACTPASTSSIEMTPAREDTTSGSTVSSPTSPTTITSTTTTTLAPTGLAPFTAFTPATVAAEADAIAVELSTVEAAIRRSDMKPARRRALAQRQQNAYRIIAEHPELLPGVVERIPPENRAAVERNGTAAVEALAITKPQPQLPAWNVVAPAPAEELLGAYMEAGAQSGLQWEYLAAINLIETRMGRIRGTSNAGAQGPMQFIPSTWERWGAGGDINNPRDAIMAAGRFLADKGGAADMTTALYRYNPTEHYVRAVEAYAANMIEDADRYLAYYHWQVFYRHEVGTVVLQVGYTPPG